MREHVPLAVRRAALAEELEPRLRAAGDLDRAAAFRRHAPEIGQPTESYLDRWLSLDTGAEILAGPRYFGLDPDLPFVGVTISDRPLIPDDREALVRAAGPAFAPFRPGFVLVTTADPLGAWPGTGAAHRLLVGQLGQLRARQPPAALSAAPRADMDVYERYAALHAADAAEDPRRARWTWPETRADLEALAAQGLVLDVLVDGVWAGLVAAEPGVQRGVRGAVVMELILDRAHRGRGYGRHLSTLLARALPLPDDQALMGTIHADNVSAYRSALRAGRVDVGGEVTIPL